MNSKEKEQVKKFENIKQICPMCNNEFIIKDFNLFMEKLRDSWALASSKFKFKELPKEQQEFIKKQNREEIIIKALEKGFVKMVCQPCNVLLFYETLEETK